MSAWQKKGLHTEDKQGLNTAQDWVTFYRKCSSQIAWDSVALDFEYFLSEANIVIEIDPWYFVLDHRNSRIILSRYIADNYMYAADLDFFADRRNSVKINCNETHAEICVNGESLSTDSYQVVRMTFAYLHFPPNTIFSEPNFSCHIIDEPHAKYFKDSPKHTNLEFTVDFYDDLVTTAFDQKKLDAMFNSMAELGAKQAYWIDHNKRGCGFWEFGPIAKQVENAAKSFDMLGEDYLPPAVTAAHKNDIKLIGILKPFDTAIVHSTVSYASNKGFGDALGGRMTHAFCFPAEHPEFCMKRRNIPATPSRICKIEISSRKELSADLIKEIELWISDDNSVYELYDGPSTCVLNGKTISFESLEISNKFVVMKFPSDLAGKIANVLPQLAKVYDLFGNEIEFTYGLVPRREYKQEFHLDRKIERLDFRTNGMSFDNAGTGIPNALWNHKRIDLEIFSPADNMNALGIAAAVNPVVPAVLSEAEPAAHEFWLEWIERMLDAGVDGVEIRIMNHGNIIHWDKYGFNSPLVEEYKKRWGVDIISEDYDMEKLQQLRGEFLTDFLRKASSLVRSRDKKFCLHIEDMHYGPVSEPCFMCIHLPLLKWIDEKICDAVTLKALNSKTHMTAFGRDVIAAANENGIPVNYAPFYHAIADGGDDVWEAIKAMPLDAFNVYEYATVFITHPDGKIEPVSDRYMDCLKKI